MTKLRISIAATLMVASLICTVLAIPRGLTRKQAAALKKCQDAFYEEYDSCMSAHWISEAGCEYRAYDVYTSCLDRSGLGWWLANRPPPLLPHPSAGPIKPGNPKPTPPRAPVGPIKGSPTPTPKPTPPRAPVGPIKVGSPTPTPPTIFAKPKATPTPHKDHKH